MREREEEMDGWMEWERAKGQEPRTSRRNREGGGGKRRQKRSRASEIGSVKVRRGGEREMK